MRRIFLTRPEVGLEALVEKGQSAVLTKQKPVRLEVKASWIPVAHPFHSRMMDLRMWSSSLASVRKEEPQAVQVKGRMGEEGA